MVQFTGRRDDGRLLTGRGRYTADVVLPGQLHAVFLRADRAHAAIRGIDVAGAAGAPGVHAVLTGADAVAAGFDRAPNLLPYKGVGDEPLRTPPRPALAQGRVRFVGEPVAVVVADTVHQAEDAAELIVVDYDDLDPVIDPAAALAPGAPSCTGWHRATSPSPMSMATMPRRRPRSPGPRMWWRPTSPATG